MRIARFDHVAIPTSDIAAMAAFYAALGFEAPDVAEWQGDPPPFCSLRFGDNMINLHGPEMWRDGNLTLRAGGAIIFRDGFSVGVDGVLTARVD